MKMRAMQQGRMKKPLHPLDYWLLDQDMSLPVFGKTHDLALRALYNLVDERRQVSPRLSTLLAVEAATKRKVTVQAMANWFRRGSK